MTGDTDTSHDCREEVKRMKRVYECIRWSWSGVNAMNAGQSAPVHSAGVKAPLHTGREV